MKFLTGWVLPAGLVLAAGATNAQAQAPNESGRSPSTLVSDIDGPYAAMPPEMPGPRYGPGPTLLPPTEVYTVLRENGFLPLGIPRQRGLVYTISVLDRSGDNGRLVIDARTGRIIRFMPAYRMGDNFSDDPGYGAGPAGPLPPVSAVRGPPRPPAPIPRVASRTPSVPTPRPSPQGAAGEPKPLAANPAAASKPAAEPPAQQQSAVVQAKPAPQAAAPAPVEAKPAAPPILPTQEMPQAQGLD
jgi:hypothetical protein